MSDSETRGFLGRWSRRKAEARQSARQAPGPAEPATLPDAGVTPTAEPYPPAQPGAPRAQAPAVADPSRVAKHTSAGLHDEQQRASVPSTAAHADAVAQPTLPTFEDVRALTADSDFSRFVGRGVAPDVRNAAMKKLFADPHFNVMDGLDIYIDDYTGRETLPESTLRAMVSSKFLNLFDETPEAAGDAVAPDAASDGASEGESLPNAHGMPDAHQGSGETPADAAAAAAPVFPKVGSDEDASMIESANAAGVPSAFPVSDKVR